MATEASDPRTFNTWEDAFQFPVPVVQKLEQQLRNHAAENRDKLRSLVGASYRDLLETAETIITMSSHMSTVEASLTQITHNTNSRQLDRIAQTTARSHAQARGRDRERYMFAARMATLRNCPVVIARLLRGEELLLAAKVLVVGRLVHKALAWKEKEREREVGGGEVNGLVEKLREKLGVLRARLLRRVDRLLARGRQGMRKKEETGKEKGTDGNEENDDDEEGEKEVNSLVEAMCAYALATSSTPSDVLRHFHHVRLEHMLSTFQRDDSGTAATSVPHMKEKGIEALKLCLKTTHDTQTIFPRRLADALARLKTCPLVQDPAIRALYELNLDIHERWLGDEARTYTPQPRHDELKRPEADRLLAAWGKQAISAFLKEMKTVLAESADLKEVAELRQELMELWLVRGARMAGVRSRAVLDELRGAMNAHLATIVRSRTQHLSSVVDLVTQILSTWPVHQKPLSLWDATASSSELSNGAQAFRTKILNLHRGRDGFVREVTATFDRWMVDVLEVDGVVRQMREIRWDDPFGEDLEDEDEEEGGESVKQVLLSGDDPRMLEETTQEALASALALLSDRLAGIAKEITDGDEEQERLVTKSVFLLRVVREIGTRTARLKTVSTRPSPFATALLEPLHTTLAMHILTPVLATYRTSLSHTQHNPPRITALTTLWEGTPPLPAQPSPSAFRLLRDLTRDMGKLGPDLWGTEAVGCLKRVVGLEMGKVWMEYVDGLRKGLERVVTPDSPEPVVAGVDKDERAMEEDEEDKAETKDKEVSDEDGDGEGDGEGEEEKAAHTPPSSEDAATPRVSAETTNTDSTSDSSKLTKEQVVDALKQLVFDVWYIRFFLFKGEEAGEGDEFQVPYDAAGLEGEKLRARVRKSVGEYVKRTWLLFAVLRP